MISIFDLEFTVILLFLLATNFFLTSVVVHFLLSSTDTTSNEKLRISIFMFFVTATLLFT